MNRVEVSGGLTRDPEFRLVGAGSTPLMEFSVAVNGTRYDAASRQQVVKTTFVSVQVWGLQAEQLADLYALKQGDEVYVLGELDQREIEKADGSKERKTRVTAFYVQPLRATYAGRTAPVRTTTEPPF